MKVIVAGLSKTGTKSMKAALTQLGYTVYDFAENVYLLREDYKKIFSEGWTTEDFKRIYQNVDAIVDVPACYFWEEIHKAFPDAKIILTVRASEDEWFRSLVKQQEAIDNNMIFRMIEILSPTQRKAMKDVGYKIGSVVWGLTNSSPFRGKAKFNEQLFKLKYRQHNAYVLQNAPPEKLLVYKCSSGWEPLCQFLGSPIPDCPFPHKNIRGNIVKEVLETEKVFIRMQKEVLLALGLIVALLAIGCYYLYSLWSV